MIGIIITLLILATNHVLQIYFQHDAIAIDICIGIGYLMYLFL